MSTLMDYIQCPQCGYEQADTEFDCRTTEERTNCRKCGFSEYVDREADSEGKFAFKHQVVEGAGVLFYRWKGAIAYTCHYLAAQEKVIEAEKWLLEKLAAGQMRPGSAYLSRWDKEANAVEFVVGHFSEPFGYDPDDETPEQKGPNDLRQFQLAEKRCMVKLRYSCEHILNGWILLLKGQPERSAGTVFRTSLPCLSCLPKYNKSLGVSDTDETAASPEKRRTWLWENRDCDGRSVYVTPAFVHPETLQEAASMFYEAYPERKQCHPESMGFHLQLEGWTDEEIASKKWLRPE